MAISISVCASIFAALVTWTLIDFATRDGRRLRARLREVLADAHPESAGAAAWASPAGVSYVGFASAEAVSGGVASGGTALGGAASVRLNGSRKAAHITGQRRLRFPIIAVPGSLLGRRFGERLRSELARAGIPLKPEELVSMAAILGFGGFILGMLFFRRALFATVPGVLGVLVPFLWVHLAKKERSAGIEGQLLNALVLIANSLRAGHSFMQALELVQKEMEPPLAQELGRVIRESKMGIPVEEALLNLTRRVESRDLDLAVTGVLIQRQVGGNLARVLDNIALTIDRRIKTRARIRVVTAQGRISAWIISILPFALGVLVFGMYPEFGRVMFSEPMGIGMLMVAGILLVVGIFLVRRVVNIDV
ncbi:MAG: type II secretion system F family protein [Candidatus Fermentithermobacillus carboniphilus]|uniref:Type II secretion system F family protein n=1 Tax=Candidatus Fermentithermobacillus carboniphilus TaxID=3085328 RepID=A0AAT9LBL4_9FIRM|nr:MAG: type II secretion system F family protein [Candidatus Fermentithermobacillus carboniphilus]